MAVFAEWGYQESSMVQIARAAGITVAVIYDYFPSKAALQVELLERETAALLAFVRAALERVPTDTDTDADATDADATPTATKTGTGMGTGTAAAARDRLRAGADAFFRFVEEHGFAWRMLFRDAPSDPEVAAAYARLSAEATAGIAAFIEAGAGDALASYADPAQAAEMFAQMMRMAQNGLAAWWYEHREVPRGTIVQRLLDFCWLGLERVATGDR